MRYFTKQQIEDIRKQLATLGVKDSDFPETSTLDGEEYVVVVQDGSNYKVKIKDLFSEYVTEDILEHITQGKSAYDIAVENGFSGSIDDWLDSLKGATGEPGVTSATAALVDDGGNPSVDVIKVGNRLDFRFNNTVRGGGDTPVVPVDPYVLPAASSGALGGIKIGRGVQNSREYPVELDASNRAFVRVPWTGGEGGDPVPYELPVATSNILGGVKVGYGDDDTHRLYGVQLNGENKAYVHVPWSSSTEGNDGGHWENAFAAVEDGIGPGDSGFPALPNLIDDSSLSSAWKHYSPDNEDGTLVIWMATRWVDGSGNANSWQGPWRVSGPGGENGLDGDTLEFIYTRTNNETDPIPSLTNTTPDSSKPGRVPTDDDFVPSGWKDNASDPSIQINSVNRVMWMAFRVKSSSIDPVSGQEVRNWSAFIGPFMWSVWGRQGLDGDGVEYIFYAGTTLLNQYLPDTWNINTVGYNNKTWEDREFRMNGQQGNWLDDPIDLGSDSIPQGTKQWVSIRRKYADNAANRSNYTISADTSVPYWHAYSAPALWGYKGIDGDAGTGVVGDLSNEIMAIPLDGSGKVTNFSQTTTAIIYNGAATVTPSSVTIDSIKDSAGTTYQNNNFNGGSGLISISGSTITAAVRATDNFSLENKSLNVVLNITASIIIDGVSTNITRSATLTLVGVHFGSDGASYSLETSTTVIRHSNGLIEPDYIDVSCLKVIGIEPIARYTAESSSLAQLNASVDQNFYFKYKIGDEGALIDLTAASVSTASVNDYITFYLYYGTAGSSNPLLLVDQETIYVVSDGVSPSARYKSVVFKRSAAQPVPSHGVIDTGSDPADANGTTNAQFGGRFDKPIPYGWSDGIPAYNPNASNEADNTLWMASRLFIEGNPPTPATTWSVSLAQDTDTYDLEFAYAQPNDARPDAPKDDPNGNRHGGSGTQIWFDPVLDKNTANWQNMVWRAESYHTYGQAKNWVITKIVGEGGTNGSDAFRLDLDNENDSMLYDEEGRLLSGPVRSVPTLYEGSGPVVGQVTYSIEEVSKTNNVNNVTASYTGGEIVVSGMTDKKGWVKVKAQYNQKSYYTKLTLTRLVGEVKYSLKLTPKDIAVDDDTDTASSYTVFVQIMRGAQNNQGTYEEVPEEYIPNGWYLIVDGDVISNGQPSSALLNEYYYGVTVEYAVGGFANKFVIPVTLYDGNPSLSGTTVIDEENILINHSRAGAPGVGTRIREIKYAIGTANTTPSNFIYSDLASVPAVPGDWIWCRVTYETTDGNTTWYQYDKERVASDGTPGASTGVVYRGEYDPTKTYYGNSARTDVVYYRATNKYYRANPTAVSSSFSNQPPVITVQGVDQVNTNYWMEFGASFDNIATGFLFAESAEIEFLEGQRILLKDSNGTITGGAQGGDGVNFWAGGATPSTASFKAYKNGQVIANNITAHGSLDNVDSNGKGITISGNILSATDSTGNVRLNISGDPITPSSPAILFPITNAFDSWSELVQGDDAAVHSSGYISIDVCSEFSVGATATKLVVPALSFNVDEVYTQPSFGSFTPTGLTVTIERGGTVVTTLQAVNQGSGNWTTASYQVSDPHSGYYTITARLDFDLDFGSGDPYYDDGGTITLLNTTNGTVAVEYSSAQLVQIGSNGLSINLGSGFLVSATLDNNVPNILLTGRNQNNATIGLRITSSGVECNNGSGWGTIVTQ